MERRALVLALALTLPLALYGIPYAYATTVAQTSYMVITEYSIAPFDVASHKIQCTSASDSALHYGSGTPGDAPLNRAFALNSGGNNAVTGENPNGWFIELRNTLNAFLGTNAYIICQSPITVAGIGVPEFGSLYVAIALGAVIYFMLSRRFNSRPTISASTNP